MDLYLLECAIDPAKVDMLAARRAEHYEFLIAHRDDIVFGGPARAEADGPPQTMVMVVRADSPTAAQAFIDAEPYNSSGGFTAVRIRPWSQVIPEPTPGSLRRTLDAERASRPGPAPA